jgi:anti-anti-sigma regulatory factor
MSDVTEEPALEVLLPAQLDQKAAYALAETLLAERGRAVRLNGAAVLRLGGQSLQVMLAGQRAWAADAQDFVLAQGSAELLAGLSLLGAGEMFIGATRSDETAPVKTMSDESGREAQGA